MRPKLRRVLSTLLSLMLVAVLGASLVSIDTEAATKASVKYRYSKDGTTDRKDRVGIKSLMIGDTNYYDLYAGKTEGRADPTVQLDFLKAVLLSDESMNEQVPSALSQWATLAEQIYGTHSKYAAQVHADGGFEKNFTSRNAAGYADLSEKLSTTEDEQGTMGSRGKDYTKWTGLQYTDSLSKVRREAADSLADAINRKVKGDDFLDSTEGKEDTLKELDNDSSQPVLYSLVTCIDRTGSTPKYSYNVFGLAFYDFQLTALAGDGLEYITAATPYDSLKEAAVNKPNEVSYKTSGRDNPVISYYKNESKQEAEVGMEFAQSNTVTTSNTLETQESYSFSEMIGSETKLGAGFFGIADVEQTINVEITCEQAMSTAWSETKEFSTTKENTVSTSMTLPAQTAAGMESSDATTSVRMKYNCPVAVTYKVAIFSLAGDVYDDNAANQSFHTAGYRQKDFITIFGSDKAVGGVSAYENLRNRAIKYKDTVGFEKSYGQTHGYEKKKGDEANRLDALDWDGITDGVIFDESSQAQKSHITVNYYEVTENEDGSVSVGTSPFKTINSDTLYPVGYESPVSAYDTYTDENNVAYQLYTGKVIQYDVDLNADLTDAQNGSHFKMVCPESGMDYPGQILNNYVDFYYKKVNTGTASTTSDTPQVMAASAEGSASIPTAYSTTGNGIAVDAIKTLAGNCPMSVTGGELTYDAKSMNSNISDIVPLYPLKTISVTNGIKSLNMISGDKFNTDNIEVEGKNRNEVAYYGFDSENGHWELCDANGAALTGDAANIATLEIDDKTGESIVTAGQSGSVYMKYVIDENCYTSLENESPTKNSQIDTAMVKINVTEKPFEGKVEASGTATFYVGDEPVNLIGHKTIKGYAIDSTDKKITGAPIEWQSRLDANDGIVLEDNKLSFTEPGEYQIRATYRGKYSDWITVKAIPARKLNSIQISDKTEPKTLETFTFGDKAEINLAGLTVNALDQYDEKWVMENTEWVVKVDGEAIDADALDGDILKIQKSGAYTIQLKCGDILSNELTLDVKEARKLKSISIEDETDPNTLEAFIFGDKTEINLAGLTVKAMDQYDAEWTMENPEWVVKVDGEAIGTDALDGDILKIQKSGEYTIQLKCGDILSNELTLDVKEARKLKSISIESEALENGLGIGDGYAYDLDKVTVTAKDQYGDDFDWAGENYEWVTGGKYSEVSQGKLTGLVGGTDTLKLIVGEGDSKLESNTIDFKVLLKPYVAELYGAKNTIEEGERFSLDDVKFNAKDQNGETYTLTEDEINSIVWSMTDKGTIESDKVVFNSSERFVSVEKGTLQYGETGSVILEAEYTNPAGQKSKATQVVLDVRQKPILDSLTLEQKDSGQVLKNGENAYNSDFFTVKGTDQYGNDYALNDDIDFTWNSDNENAFVFDNSKDLIKAVNPGTSAKVTVTAKNSIDKDVTSNELELSVPRVKKLSSITMEGAPEVLALGTDFDMNTLKVTCYDELKQAYGAEELEAYPAEIRFTLDNGETDTRLDTAKNTLTTGDKYGYITVSAMAVNSSTTNTITDSNGVQLVDSIKIWVGPKVEKISAETKMNADAGNNTIELTGQCLQDNMKIGLFDADGNLITEEATAGSESKQTAKLKVPDNIGGASNVTYTVKYAIKDKYMDSPTEEITVTNKIPAVSVKLNMTKLVLEPGKTKTLKATINPGNSTDSTTWKSSKTSVATVNKNGIVKAVSPGTAVITVRTESGVIKKCNVTVGLRKGDVFTKGLYRYKVTNSKVDGNGTASVVGFAKGQSARSVKLASVSSWNGINYKVTSIGDRAFYRNNKIQNVTIGSNVRIIGSEAFKECKKIEKCTISNSVETIKKYAFSKCYAMKELVIGKNVKTIERHAFCINPNLKKIVFRGTALKKLGTPHVFLNVNKATVYVPKAKYVTYKKMLSNYGLAKCKFKKF